MDDQRAANQVVIESLMTMMHIQFFVLFDALFQKNLIDYAGIQESISVVRELVPPDKYTPQIRMFLDAMEQQYRPGHYRSPFGEPCDPQP